MKPLFLYTMTSGLGDFIVMGDLMKKVEAVMPQARCFMAHRGNPHIKLWPYDPPDKRFFDIYQPKQFLRLILTLKKPGKMVSQSLVFKWRQALFKAFYSIYF